MHRALVQGLTGLVLLAVPATARGQDGEPISYIMRSGDTLHGLAARWLVRPAAALEVQAFNRIADDRRIPVGRPIAIPRRLLRADPVDVRIVTFSGPVSVIAAGRAAPASRDMVLAEGAEIATGARGFVTLATRDGSRVSLPSNSRVRLVSSRRYRIDQTAEFDVQVLSGRAEATAVPQKPGNRFRLRTPVAVSAVRGTAFRVGWHEDEQLGLTEVTEGEVGVATPQAGIDVPAGFGAAARPGGDLKRETLLPPPDAIEPGRVQTEEGVRFALRPVEGARGYRILISGDAGFTAVLAESTAAEPQIELPGLGNGTFFFRATAIAASGLEGMGQVWSFRRQRLGVETEAGASAVPGGLRFSWMVRGEGKAVHRFQLFPAGAGTSPLIDRPGLAEPGLTLTGLVPGTYRWRVGVTETVPDGSAEVWTPFQTLTVSG